MNSSLDCFVLKIPPGLDFSELEIVREPDGRIRCNRQALERVCAASGLDLATLDTGRLLWAWYIEHLRRGGAIDPILNAMAIREWAHRKGATITAENKSCN